MIKLLKSYSLGLRTAKWSDIEDMFYERVVKVTPLIAAGYCPLRALIGKGDKRKVKATAKDLIVNAVSIVVAYVLIQNVDCKLTPCLNC